MKINLFILFTAITILSACGNGTKSQLVVLYKGAVAPGNSVVYFINWNDETGQFATIHCEELKALYMERNKIPYTCSTVVFDEFKPSIK